ncbi:ArsR/SmtB family transcription factor [Lentibacillus cibarius]|uniref:Winged helix-turn-helix transcriptional regulator n=1 Tax=Lentibacillus cibarius TaxID=2583219 RepID=A0A5S3QLD7_9BACI|nr:metalloregulator ArsR/SmtB family transcription factor [Lentibacillus cibarius]TMN22547.1 winged helix-turn-helix transcriptional regulator [Lentibacillus cibarius]
MEQAEMSVGEAAAILKLLGDRTRLSIVLLLHHKRRCVCELVEALEMSQPSISQHLRKLRDAHVVLEDRQGQWIYYTLNTTAVFFPLVERILAFIPERETLTKKMGDAKTNHQC